VGFRNRALIGVIVYTFARVGTVITMRVEDYYQNGKRWWFRLHEKGRKRHEVPANHKAEALVNAYMDAGGLWEDKKGALFRTIHKQAIDGQRQLTDRAMDRNDVLRMIKRRAKEAGLPESTCCHTFKATGITAYLENWGTIEGAQAIAAHESPRKTKL
jgi:integrase/recombinase XerD